MGLRDTLTLVRRHYRLLLKTWLLLLSVRFALTFRSYHDVLRRIERAEPSSRADVPTVLLVWSVAKAARFVPQATCLTRALTIRLLLAHAGKDGTIHVGVRTDATGALKAHAWVTRENEILSGGPAEKISQYKPIAIL